MSYDVLGGYTWDDIMGEQTRGGQDDVVGTEMVPQRNPAFSQQIARRVAAQRPVMNSNPPVKARDWQIGLGPVSGTSGQTQTISVTPQCFFRAEKLIASDNAGTVGTGTALTAAFVGQKNQLPVGAGSGGSLPTYAFDKTSLGNGIKWDTCQPAISISLQISFSASVTWSGVLFGKAVVA